MIGPDLYVDATDPSPRGRLSEKRAVVSVRASSRSYWGAVLLLSFFSGFLVYLGLSVAGSVLFFAAWAGILLLAWKDNVVFDGKRIRRTGVAPNLWYRITGLRNRLKLTDIEQVDTQSLRALKRGGTVHYRYSTSVRGKGVAFSFTSGRADYQKMVAALFSSLPENILDTRSLELRDYLRDPNEVLTKAEISHVPSAEVLEHSLEDLCRPRTSLKTTEQPADPGQAEHLRRLANELRLTGFLLRALEVFRRALLLQPRNGWLWLEYGRCLRSFAGSENDPLLDRRSIAMMRLAERYAEHNGDLLARLGESYCQAGEWERAQRVFGKAIEATGQNFRAARGLAEVALRKGKIAHVILHFSNAIGGGVSPALRRWTLAEAAYFARLNNDREYMEMELSRVNLLDKLEEYQGTVLWVAISGFPLIMFGSFTGEYAVADVGWAVSIIALLTRTVMLLSRRILSTRIEPDAPSDSGVE